MIQPPLRRPRRARATAAVAIAALLAGCATPPVPTIQRTPTPVVQTDADPVARREAEASRARLLPGSGQLIDRDAAMAPPPRFGGGGEATFNFEGESVHAVVKAILGDLLQQNYVIAPGVQGTVTLATPRPVGADQALSLLETALAWNNARLVWSDGRYSVVPADQAVAGNLAPSAGSAASARGYEVRAVPLRYISAIEMEKVLTPYTRPGSIINVDNGRNVITLAGTGSELANYLRTVEIFDVDWLAGMSVGIFPLDSANAEETVEQLDQAFGPQSETPVAGMFRFMPLAGTNSIMVITPQPRYLGHIERWLREMDAGSGAELFTYQLKYVKAYDLAQRLSEVYGGSGGGGGSLAPGLTRSTVGSMRDTGTTSSRSGRSDGLSSGGSELGALDFGGEAGVQSGSVQFEIEGQEVGVAAVEESNALIVRANRSRWESIRRVIEQLDVMPAQVHIEAQIVEVSLSGDLRYGVSWFFDNAVGNNLDASDYPGLAQLAASRRSLGSYAGSITPGSGLGWIFAGDDSVAILSALDEVSDVQVLSTPSVTVRNNAEASLNVGDQVPIITTSINTITGSDTALGTTNYIDTGTILKVRPRVSGDGTVFMEIIQEISTPDYSTVTADNPNPSINTRQLQTEAAVRSGETIMLAGLISDSSASGRSGIPGLSRIPVIGALFGQQTRNTDRQEVVILITPRVLRNAEEARDFTDQYGARFRALEPLRTQDAAPRQP
ncbi:type II secretion system secretin GspD [Coralloluteibacterium stylophorae]|uniref:Type II secretion system secretin GspD n=1 Tax=Coralloluteibacterium stylophorae TaxID=1776034 RepID=A0A8J8AXE7_9GAMM|nr:type II secretion system secretin GspD [Coralloluteibacterium stylophorae]MBS7457772.1 type II secretion system secretin GspD [Coralloluteibacterium stylophorae]